MGTRSIIAKVGKNEGEFAGRYCHWDGHVTTKIPMFWKIVNEQFDGNWKAAVRYMVDEHPAGWSSLEQGECYCHPERADREDFKRRKPEPAQKFTHKQLKDSDAEFLYVFDVEKMRLYARDVRHDAEAIIDLTQPEPTKEQLVAIECGENFERCSHYAWYHDLVPRTCNLSTAAWLGQQALDFQDAVAFIIGGKRYTATGSGGNSDFYNTVSNRLGTARKIFPRGTWIASVKAGNNRRMEFPVAKIEGDKYTPMPNVIWVYPPTRDNPKETKVTA